MKIVNKRASFDYELTDEYEAGISLLGSEAKSLRNSRADLSGAQVRIMSGQAYLINAGIFVDNTPGYNSRRLRKLLLNRSELTQIETRAKQKRLTLVPVCIYNKGRLFKLKLALGKPKHKFEKKESIKRKDIERDIERSIR